MLLDGAAEATQDGSNGVPWEIQPSLLSPWCIKGETEAWGGEGEAHTSADLDT